LAKVKLRLLFAEQQRRQREAETEQQRQQREAEQRAAIAQAEQVQIQAALERRKCAALSRIAVTSTNIECLYPALPGCSSYKITATFRNQSSENITMLAVGWVFMSAAETSCPTYLQTKHKEEVRLRPGDSIVMNIDSGLRSDGPPSKQFNYCVGVADGQIVP
jgi:hypothetical protein